MDKIEKALHTLSEAGRKKYTLLLLRIRHGDFAGLDIKKLQGRDDIFRVRKGRMRIIFRKTKDGILILAFEQRNDNTYNLF